MIRRCEESDFEMICEILVRGGSSIRPLTSDAVAGILAMRERSKAV